MLSVGAKTTRILGGQLESIEQTEMEDYEPRVIQSITNLQEVSMRAGENNIQPVTNNCSPLCIPHKREGLERL